jgi:chemotaxis protein CheD
MTQRREAVTIGEARAAGKDTILFTLGLGSCVAIVLYDGDNRIGGLAHALLPTPRSGRNPAPAARYASTAVDVLIRLMEGEGANSRRLRAKIAGGASMFDSVLTEGGRQLGMRNVEAARSALARAGIPVDREDVGGNYGRSVYLHVDEGRVVVSSVMHPDVIL